MRAPFLKMHGAGNDFVVFDERAGELALTPGRIRHLADRRFGIGCDQLIRLRAPTAPGADVRMLIHNPDGSTSGTCGNATRCVASLLEGGTATIETGGGLLASRRVEGGLIEVDMGAPRLDAAAVPLARAALDTLHLPLAGDPAACSMGNPHATFFVGDLGALDAAALAAWGRAVELDPLFPQGANVGFAQVLDPDRIRLRVWERGAGLTLACGSGACAAVVNAARRGLAGRAVRVELAGGVLDIAWREGDGHVLMIGPATTAFDGSVELDGLPA